MLSYNLNPEANRDLNAISQQANKKKKNTKTFDLKKFD